MRLSASIACAFSAAAALVGVASAQLDRVRIDNDAFGLGTLSPADGALSRDLWSGADSDAVADLLVTVPAQYDEPLHLEVLRRVLLSPGDGPDAATNALAGQKFLKAAEAGFYSDAAALASLVPNTGSEPALARVVAYKELMDGQIDTACARGEGLRDGRAAPFWIKLRFVCYVRAGESAAADLTYNLLGRQDALTTEEAARFSAYAKGGSVTPPSGDVTLFDWVMLQDTGFIVDQAFLDRVGPGLNAAIARNTNVAPDVREAAMLKALSQRTMGWEEAVNLLDAMGTTRLATDYLSVAAAVPGSLEYAEALSTALLRDGADIAAFKARAHLFTEQIAAASPVTNFAPNATEIALAAMMTGQGDIAETWISALAADQTRPTGVDRARQLVSLYAHLDATAAERVGAYLGMIEEPEQPAEVIAFNADPSIPVVSLVAAALPAAQAGSSGPASLVYLASMDTLDDGEAGIRQTVTMWARDRAALGWMDEAAAFQTSAAALLAEPVPAVAVAPLPTTPVTN